MTASVTNATTPTAATSASSSTNTSSINSGLSGLADNYQTFLTLLTTQLQNQDPLSPEDTSQFTSQITQMTGVEQQLLSNQLLQQLVSANQGDGLTGAVGLIGKTVTSSSTTSTLTSGQASWTYTLPTAAAGGTVNVLNSGGNVVYSAKLSSTAAGAQTFTWNGQTTGGTQLANGGTYTLQIQPVDSSGNAITVTNGVTGTATAAEQVNGVTMVTINGVQVPMSTISTVQ
jgi:flagellar basal-body rod modification protein FlgD